jgi:V8-like Glu-specific endopeptidase
VAKLRSWPEIIGLAALLAGAGTARPAIFNEDDRLVVAQQPGSPYASIGRVIGDGSAGTGFLVSECHVLTVQHAFSEVQPAVGHRMTFRAAPSDHAPQSSRGTIVASGNSNVALRAQDYSEGRSKDWMLIRLDQCLGKSLGYVEISVDETFSDAIASAPVRSAGFPQDRPSADTLIMDSECKIRASSFRELMHDCATLPGNSGSPVFREVRSGGRLRLRVVAMVTCGEHMGQPAAYNAIRPNRATKMAYILPAIKDFI